MWDEYRKTNNIDRMFISNVPLYINTGRDAYKTRICIHEPIIVNHLATITDDNNLHRDYIVRVIKLPLAADDLNSEIFIFINNAVIANAYLILSTLILPTKYLIIYINIIFRIMINTI